MKKVMSIPAMFALLLAVAVSAQAQITTPALADGKFLSPTEAPCRTFNVSQTTGTAEAVIATTPGYLAWVVLSTASADGSVYTVFKDTSALSAAQKDLMRVNPTSSTQMTKIDFNPPLVFVNGLTIAQSAQSSWTTACYRLYSTQVP